VLKGRPRYIGLVASRKRFESVMDYLKQQGVDEDDLKRVKAPAGLDIQAQQGDEIALSIMAEIVQYRRTTEAEWDALSSPPPGPLPATQGGGEELSSVSVGTAIDPVCLMSVDVATAKFTYDYEGTTYYFCAPGCKMAFRKNPQEYLHPARAIDPVCGMEVDTASAQHTSVYHGHTFYFCGPGCKATFEANPEAHLVMHH
jgi:YHS domain-containing protein